ncbi:MAG: (Fe-S)-binding protein [Candidatus Omnitrophota bacterium]
MEKLPGLDCGLCGRRSCGELALLIKEDPSAAYLCPYLSSGTHTVSGCSCASTGSWNDSLGRPFDFILDTLPGDPGPRETILLYNPTRIGKQGVRAGDLLTGRPMGMSCGCPVTHCGVVLESDPDNGVIVWCISGPLAARSTPVKDIGYYSAQAYEGIVRDRRVDLKVGERYWFLPRNCMLQWRHSGLVNCLTASPDGQRARVEGLMIG